MRRALVLGVVAALAFAACTPSTVDPEAMIRIGGTVARDRGAAVEGARVALTKGIDVGEGLAVFASLGLACLDRESLCRDARVAETDERGRFSFTLEGRDTQGFFGQASTLELSTRLAGARGQLSGPGATMRFQVQTETLRTPLRFWEPRLRAKVEAGRVRVTFTGLPRRVLPDDVSVSDMRARLVFARAGGESVWEFGGFESGERFDLRLLEDTRGSMWVRAEGRAIGVAESAGTEIDLILESARLPYASPLRAPISRGLPCFAYSRSKRPVAQSPCSLTDGRFTEPFEPVTRRPCREGEDPARCAEPQHSSAYIDLGAPRRVGLVVVRGCSDRCLVETSGNARRWRLIGTGRGEDGNLAVPTATPVRARYVRVSAQGTVTTLREVSVWDDSKPRAQGALIDRRGGGSGTRGDPLIDEGGGGIPTWLLVLAAALLGAALAAAVAVLLGRRRRLA